MKRLKKVEVKASMIESTIFSGEKYNFEYCRDIYENKSVLITGVAGTIGKGLLSRVVGLGVKKVIGADSNDTSLIRLVSEYSRVNCNVEFILSNLYDKKDIKRMLSKHEIDIVIHCAAYKIVPLVERNIIESVRNNILLTKNLLEVSGEECIEKFIFVSSNEAFLPKNIFGYTKKISEMLMNVASLNYKNTRFNAIRFGFVLFSQGSVASLFRYQAENNINLTVCDKLQRKYFCSVDASVYGTLISPNLGKSGDVISMDMGEPELIYDLAKKFISYYGSDSKIDIIGLRPGDKMSEPAHDGENGLSCTAVGNLFIANIEPTSNSENEYIKENIINTNSEQKVYHSMKKVCLSR
ncbi:MAG: polysaccharide biosynthesis protein [Candidatus Izemoplasmataceae bacterium]